MKTALDWLNQFHKNGTLSISSHALACFIVGEANHYGLSGGRKPSGIAAAASYLAGLLEGPYVTQLEIVQVLELMGTEITEVTLRNSYLMCVRNIPAFDQLCQKFLDSLPAHQRWQGPKFPYRRDGKLSKAAPFEKAFGRRP